MPQTPRPPRRPVRDPWVKQWLYGQLNLTPADNTATKKAPAPMGVSSRSQFRQGLPLPQLDEPRAPGAPRRSASRDLNTVTDFVPGLSEVKAAAQGGRLAAEGHPIAGLALAGSGLIPGGIRAARAARAARVLESAIPAAGERFAVFTAENAGGRTMSAAENAARNESLIAELRQRGYNPIAVKGRYKDDTTGEILSENSFFIPGMNEREAKLVAKRYGQNSLVTQSGFHDLVQNKFYPSKGVKEVQDLPFTEMPNGRRFALDLDWNSPQQPAINTLPVPKNANPEAMRLVDELRHSMGPNAPTPLSRVKKVDAAKAQEMAAAFERLPKNDPNARSAYDQLNKEVAQQLKAIEGAGYKIEYVDVDPYKNSNELFADLRDNRRMKVLKANDATDHPYMTREQTNAFRAVHDFIAHGGGGNQFGAVGEENAYRIHASTLSPEAQRALATETRGQNSWVNFGPNAHKPVAERPFAEQKAALWPADMLGEYNAFPNAAKRPNGPLRSALGTPSEGELDDLLKAIAPRAKPPVDEAAARVAAARNTPFPQVDIGLGPSEQAIAEREARNAAHRRPGPGGVAADSVVSRGYPLVQGLVDGRTVGPNVKNVSSIGSTFDAGTYTTAKGIREVPIDHFSNMKYASASDNQRVQELAQQIKQSGRIDPLIVAIDEQGPYILEGGHRLGALQALGAKSLPAMVVEEQGAKYPTPKVVEAPNVIIKKGWQPTPRGVFDRAAPSLQGTAPIDPRLAIPESKRAGVSPFIEAVAGSKTVRKGLEQDAVKGLPQGGDSWYELGPIKADLDERAGKDGAVSFNDFVNLGSAASIQNPTTREPNTMSVMLFAMKNGISYDEAIAEMQKRLGNNVKPWLSPMHTGAGETAMANGVVAPSNPMSANWKLAWYAHGKLGGAPNAGAALDTHERKRIMQLALDNPRLAKLARETGAIETADKNKGMVPLRNALDYDAVSELYRAGARDLGLPSPQAFQAGRWIGGGEHTGLKSAPFGDYTQTIEDALLYTARTRGLGESPRELRNLWGGIVSGKDFFSPHWGAGGFPVY